MENSSRSAASCRPTAGCSARAKLVALCARVLVLGDFGTNRRCQVDFPTNCITKFASVLMLFSPGILGALARTLSLDNTKAALARCEIRKKEKRYGDAYL